MTAIFFAALFLPGYACLQGRFPGLAWLGRWLAPAPGGGLHSVAYGYALSLFLLSPVSLLCYALEAPLWVFSAWLCLLTALACVGLGRGLRRPARTTGPRRALCARLPTALRLEPLLPYGVLAALLWLQSRLGGWLDGDATFHLARIRVLLEHGFTNRDVYLSDYHFQHAYHSNLLFPVYASAAQLTGQSYLATWFYTAPWAKLMVAAGHYVLGHAVTRQRRVGYALAVAIVIVNAGETYTLYPNTLCVGYLLPMLLGVGFASVSTPARLLRWRLLLMAALAFVTAQVHSLYVIYAGLILGPVMLLAALRAQPLRARVLRLGVVCALGAAAPFVLVSMFAHQHGPGVASAPKAFAPPELDQPPPAGISDGKSKPNQRPALAAGGGHLEKVMDSPEFEQIVFDPRRMGGLGFVCVGFAMLLASAALQRGRRLPLSAAFVAALWLAAILFTRAGATLAWKVLQTPFVVARLSTVLTSLLILGACACTLWLGSRGGQGRRLLSALLTLALWAGGTQLLGHAPTSFQAHVQAALAPESRRHLLLDRWQARRQMLVRTIPAGSTVLTTRRFARYLVMLCDCYVLAADRGHTNVQGMDKRRRDVAFMNSAAAPWDKRLRLIRHYDARLVTFERRWRHRYRWAYQHGKLIGSAAGQDVVALDPPGP